MCQVVGGACVNVSGADARGSLMFGPVVSGEPGSAELARMHLACGRIAGAARATAEAHRFGAPQGAHDRLWDAEYHAEAAGVYGESLPASYQRDIASLFHDSADTMAAQTIPARLAEDWVIVTTYMRNASAAIMDWLSSSLAGKPLHSAAGSSQIDDRIPMVIRFDRLAALASTEGARRLERAALAVQHHLGAPAPLAIDEPQRRLLRGVASGAAIVDLAEELGYSRSSMYRELSKLWEALEVPDRAHAIQKATEAGLLD